MQQPQVQRKLMAILAADMVGYSRLMELDEAGTLARLKARRVELIDPSILKNNGRIIKTTGDGVLAEFASAVEATRCALEIQQRMARRNADVETDRQIQFRIGINIGDVIVDGNDIFGEGTLGLNLIDNDTIRPQANANTKNQFIESPDLSDAVADAVLGNRTSHTKMADYFFTDDHVKVPLVRLLGELVHENIRAPAV